MINLLPSRLAGVQFIRLNAGVVGSLKKKETKQIKYKPNAQPIAGHPCDYFQLVDTWSATLKVLNPNAARPVVRCARRMEVTASHTTEAYVLPCPLLRAASPSYVQL